jgi:hypothetical protein
LCSLPRNGSERNSENLHLFWFHGTEFRVVFSSAERFGKGSLILFLFHRTEFRVIFSSAEGFGMEFQDFLFRGTTGIPSEITICSVYSVFRGIIFLSEIPNPTVEGSLYMEHTYLDMAPILTNASLDIVGKFYSLDQIHG